MQYKDFVVDYEPINGLNHKIPFTDLIATEGRMCRVYDEDVRAAQEVAPHVNAAFVFFGNIIIQKKRHEQDGADRGKSRLIYRPAILRRRF